MAGPRSPFPLRYLDKAVGFLVPLSQASFPVLRPRPPFQFYAPPFFVPCSQIYHIIKPSTVIYRARHCAYTYILNQMTYREIYGQQGRVSFVLEMLYLKGGYHQCVSNVKYAVVSLTTLQREQCFAISERFVTSPLVTSQISREGKDVTTY